MMPCFPILTTIVVDQDSPVGPVLDELATMETSLEPVPFFTEILKSGFFEDKWSRPGTIRMTSLT